MRGPDKVAYTEYVQARAPRLRRIATLLCGDPHRADDLVQETCVKLYLHWAKATKAAVMDRYVERMLYRVFLDEKRLNWSARVRLADQVPEKPAGQPDPADAVAVRTALGTIPPGQRAALVLRYYGDLSVRETAEVMNCSEGTVKSQTAHGLTALKAALADNDGTDGSAEQSAGERFGPPSSMGGSVGGTE